MPLLLILIAVIIFSCVGLNNVSSRIGIPMLLAFLILGMFFGLLPIEFRDVKFVEEICTFALVFIMFYGGFGTRWQSAKPVTLQAGLLATCGVILTAFLVGAFCHWVLGWSWVEGLLMGSVISSTDAASVFSILRSKNLGLKNNISPLLEVESGSNDPCSYMLTIIFLTLMKGDISAGQVVWMVFAQIVFGALGGLLIAQAAIWAIRRFGFASGGFGSLFFFGVAIFSYALPSLIGGNGYLSAYIVGIILGNADYQGKKPLVHFFDGLTSLMQVMIFFLLGFIAQPSHFGKAILPALAIIVFLTFIARPIAVGSILSFFKRKRNEQALVSFVGLRGAASIVFAIMATVGNGFLQHDILAIVFCIVLISIAAQGTLIPRVSARLDMIDRNQNVMRTFTDYNEEETDIQFSQLKVEPEGPWDGKLVKELGLPKGIILALVIRDGKNIIPKGNTRLHSGDTVVTSQKLFSDDRIIRLIEHRTPEKLCGHRIDEYPESPGQLIVLIRRDGDYIIPRGDTVLQSGDILILNTIYELKS